MELPNARLYQSLPCLDITSCYEYRTSSRRSRKKQIDTSGNDALNYTLAAFYAKILVILGFALPITDAIAADAFDTYDGFYMYLYIGSITFLCYMYCNQMRRNSPYDSSRNSKEFNRQSSVSSDSFYELPKNYIRYGSFYFRMGVTGFGIGSVIYSGLEFGQYFELSSNQNCDNILKAIKPVCKIIFTLMQMFFIFSFSNVVDVQRTKPIARFGLMHMIATNLCEWLFVLVQETQQDIYMSTVRHNESTNFSNVDLQFINSKAFQITRSYYEHKYFCLNSQIMDRILVKVVPYLAPCTVEYSLLCAVILGLMWKNICTPSETELNKENSEVMERQSGCNVIYSKRQSQFSVDCAQAHKGLFIGILVLAVTIISLIMFFELVSMNDYKDAAVLQVNIWESALFWAGTISVIFCLHSLKDVDLRKTKRKLQLEHILLLVTQCGLFMYFLFQIIGGILMGLNKGKGGMMRILAPVSALIQSCAQTVLVLDAWRRRCTTKQHMRQKPGRQFITFLLVVNICLWLNNRLKNNQSAYHPNQMDFYGILTWNIITHVSMPLVLSYRFQSTVCFYEIWKHVYKVEPNNRNTNMKEDLQL